MNKLISFLNRYENTFKKIVRVKEGKELYWEINSQYKVYLFFSKNNQLDWCITKTSYTQNGVGFEFLNKNGSSDSSFELY